MASKYTDCKWTDAEIQILLDNGREKTGKELAVLLFSHSETAVKRKLTRLKLKTSKEWNEDEVMVLINHPTASMNELSDMLPGRNTKSISKKRIRLGLSTRKTAVWLAKEIELLEKHGQIMLSSELALLLPRHTQLSIQGKFHSLGMKKTQECLDRRIKLAVHARSCLPFGSFYKLNQSLTLDSIDENVVQVLLGSVLGDGCCNMSTKHNAVYERIIFTEGHGWKQKDYVLWKQVMLEIFEPKYNESHHPQIATSGHKIFVDIRKDVYEEQHVKNRIPNWIADRLNIFGLLVWYLDDGHLGRPKSGRKKNGKPQQTYPHITAKGFYLSDLQYVSKSLNDRFGFNTYVKTKKHKGGLNKLLCFNKDKEKLFAEWHDLAARHKIPNCMMYKLNDERIK
jgi:hypothetical protein